MLQQLMQKLSKSSNFFRMTNLKFGEVYFISLFFLFFPLSLFANAFDPAWLKLMRYEKTMFGYESEVDSKNYFFAQNGKHSPESELKASIVALSSPLDSVEDVNKHPRCQFPGRFLYLKKKNLISLNADFSMCEEYKTYQKKIDINSLSIIFSSYYINRPASAFGHTFLKIDSSARKDNDLFSYGVDYSAQVTSSNPFIYGVYGIFGGFFGRFTSMPYFLKLREYNDLESRDLYEFKLNLSEEEIKFAEAHLWDMNNALFHYYYLTENCSYHVLRFIDAISPHHDLMPTFYSATIPVDTLYALLENKKIIKEVTLRPSLQKRLNDLIENSNSHQNKLIRTALKDENLSSLSSSSLSEKEKAESLDILAQFIDYKYSNEILLKSKDEEAVKVQDFKREILISRSQIDVDALTFQNKYKIEKIDLGHKARRATLSSLSRQDGVKGINFQNRVALHEITDRAGDIFSNFSLEMGKVDIDFYDKENIQVNKLELASVLALRPWTILEKTFSWNFSVGLGNSRVHEKIISPYLNLGVGVANTFFKNFVSYLSFDSRSTHVFKESKIRETLVGGKYALYFSSDLIRTAFGFGHYRDLESKRDINIFDFTVNYSLTEDFSLVASGSYDELDSRTQLGVSLYY